ncbi:hypothetical protein Tco_0962550, partial [Tanacetum coccineum]
METYTSLTKRVLALEEAKTAQDRVITRLKLRVKRLEKKRKARTPQPMKRRLFKGRVKTSTDKSLEMIMEDKDSGEKGGKTARPEVSAASVPVNVSAATPSTPPTTTTIFGNEDLTIAQTLVKMRSEKAKEKEKGVVLIDEEEPPRLNRSTITLQPLPTIDPKDKGKGVLVEEEPEKPVKVKRRDQWLAQIESDAELAQSAALAEEFDEIQAKIDADHELAVRLTHEEQEKYTIEERARLLAEFFERRKKQLATERAKAIKKQTTYKNSSQEQDDYLPQTIDPKDKGKGVLVEEEPEKPVKVKRRDQGLAQIESDAELAQRLHEEELAELDRVQKERQKQEEATGAALAEEFDEIQARIDADHELAVILTHEEQEKYIIEERAILLAEFFEHDDYLPQTYGQQQAESTKKRPRADFEKESSKKQTLEEDNDAEKEKLRDSMD